MTEYFDEIAFKRDEDNMLKARDELHTYLAQKDQLLSGGTPEKEIICQTLILGFELLKSYIPLVVYPHEHSWPYKYAYDESRKLINQYLAHFNSM